jgi:transposase
MIELRDLVLQLRRGESIKSIHRSSGSHKTVIRKLKAIAEQNHWLDPETSVPTESEVQAAWLASPTTEGQKQHPLEVLNDDFKRWIADDVSLVVMHRLASKRIRCSEPTLRRYVHRRFKLQPQATVLRVPEPGKVMEVDFGYLGLVEDESEGRVRKAWLFSARLRYSRKAFRRIVFSQHQSVFSECHIEAFEWFGGVPATVVPDNLKAAIMKASWEDPLVNRAYRNLAEHYGFTISPCKPFTPQHKGGVENDVRYVKRSFWPELREKERSFGHDIPRFSCAQTFLVEWNDTVSETRNIGKVGSLVPELFTQERSLLHPLPAARWDPLFCAIVKVGVDWRIQFDKAFYSVPYRFIGEQVLVSATRRTVRIFHDNTEIAVHSRATRAWQYQVVQEHGPPQATEYLATCSKGLVIAAYEAGHHIGLMADAILSDRAVDGIRPLRALVALKNRYSPEAINAVCEKLLSYGIVGYTSVKNELVHNAEMAVNEMPHFRFARDASYYREAASRREVVHG